jgi:hypothetical protein
MTHVSRKSSRWQAVALNMSFGTPPALAAHLPGAIASDDIDLGQGTTDPCRLQLLRWPSIGVMGLALIGVRGRAYTVEQSSDLLNWNAPTNSGMDGRGYLIYPRIDFDTNNTRMFYRARTNDVK